MIRSSFDKTMSNTMLSLLLAAIFSLPLSEAFVLSTTQPWRLTDSSHKARGGMTMDLESPNLRQGSPFLRSSPWKTSTPLVRPRLGLNDNQRSVRQAETSHGMPWRSSIDPTYPGDGPYYMAFWEWQMNFMKQNLTNLRALPTVSSTGRDMTYVENKNDKIRMHTIQFQSDEYELIRMTLLDGGNKTQVFTSLWYPSTSYNLPIFGVDFLLFNNVKHVCISDFQPIQDTEDAHDRTYEHLMEPIRSQFPSLHGKMTNKFFDANQFFSSQMLLGRHDDPDMVKQMMQHDLPLAFQGYVRTHVNLVQSTSPQPARADEIAQRYRAYDEYSSERDPAHGLLSRFFGQSFADEYLHDILFPRSSRTASSSK